MSKELAIGREPDFEVINIIGEEAGGKWSVGGIVEEDLKERIRQQSHNLLRLLPWESFPDFPERTYADALIPILDFYRYVLPDTIMAPLSTIRQEKPKDLLVDPDGLEPSTPTLIQ